jgi:diguanylate cyclase (GGDEF)-like protein/PAS domain S-box-containing protein
MSVSIEDEIGFRFLAENSVDILCRAGIDRVLRYVSPSCVKILGWQPAEMIGQLVDVFVFPEDLHSILAAITRHFSPETKVEPATIRMLRKDGSMAWMENYGRLVRDPVTGEPTEFVVSMRDISERKEVEERLSLYALTDGLTALANRRAFDKALEREWERTLRDGSPVSLLLLDIDRFKEFNDQYGHQVGDDCLRAVAAALQRASRAGDVVARYGGEEIAVILPSTDSSGAIEAAENARSIVECLRIPHEGNSSNGGCVTASIGVATALARQGGTMRMPEGLLQAADGALYKAKHAGRNRVSTAILIAPKAHDLEQPGRRHPG